MGRMVGIPHFLSAAAVADEKADNNELRKARLEDGGVDEGDEESALSILRISISQRMQEQFGDFIIQRTAASQGIDGGPLIDLPKLTRIECYMSLTERELDDLDRCTGSLDEYVPYLYVVQRRKLKLITFLALFLQVEEASLQAASTSTTA